MFGEIHQNAAEKLYLFIFFFGGGGGGGGAVVECLTRDQEAAGSSLTGVTSLWFLRKDTFILA